MSRYNSTHTVVFAPIYSELFSLLKEDVFQSFWDLLLIKANGIYFEISATQLGGIEYISDTLSKKYPEFLFVETNTGEAGYKHSYLTKGFVKKKIDIDIVPHNNYLQLDSYFATI